MGIVGRAQPRQPQAADEMAQRQDVVRRRSSDTACSANASRGPFQALAGDEQGRAILSLLDLRPDIRLPDPRSTVPAMVDIAGRHPRLDLLNLEAVAVARLLSGTVWLSEPATEGVLPPVLHAEGIAWRTVPIG